MNEQIPSIVDEILRRASEIKASDVHFEPREEYLRLRYRVDGLLQDGPPIHKSRQGAILSRLKVLANLDIAETRLPQDGRASVKKIDLRVSTLPTLHGEKIVIRLLKRNNSLLSLEELGMEPEERSAYQGLIRKKEGLVLVVGPTGSGKTTTLYATLSAINQREINILTIEDPIEYQLPGISQVQVNNKSGLTFARGLRSILRQDPDVIMVGEIRDLETARIAVQAALTGHLVFSTLHTHDAAAASTRLIEMGIEPYLVKATVLGVVAQRLVRKTAKGRIGIFELISGNYQSKTLEENARELVEKGVTTPLEVARVLSALD